MYKCTQMTSVVRMLRYAYHQLHLRHSPVGHALPPLSLSCIFAISILRTEGRNSTIRALQIVPSGHDQHETFHLKEAHVQTESAMLIDYRLTAIRVSLYAGLCTRVTTE